MRPILIVILGAALLAGGMAFFVIVSIDDSVEIVRLLRILVSVVFVMMGVLIGGFGGTLAAGWRRAACRRFSARLARILGGPVEPSPDGATFRWVGARNGTEVALRWTRAVPSTQVSVRIAGGAPGTFRIMPGTDRGGRLIRESPVRVGHPRFDRRYLVSSEPASLVQTLFSGERRERLVRLLMNLPQGPSLRSALTPGDLRIRVPCLVLGRESLETLLSAAEEIAAAIRETGRAMGTVVLTVGEGRCLICASPLEAEVVICLRCRTPHHRGCWEYAGECATFACGGRRWVPV